MDRVRDVMSTCVETVQADASVMDAAGRMRAFDVGSLPVVEGDRLVGFVTDRDLAVRAAALGRDGRRLKVREVMTPEVVSCRPDDEIAEAARLMQAHQVMRLAVTDDQARLCGMLTLGDLARGGHEEVAGRVMVGMVQLVPVVPAAPWPP